MTQADASGAFAPRVEVHIEIDPACPAPCPTEQVVMAMTQAILAGLASSHRPIDVGQRPLLEVNLLLTSDQRVRTLNREYRGIDQSTDVLSFSQLEGDPSFVPPPSAALALGDVVISLETARRQAVEQGHSFEWEVRHLAVHGALHLLGYDHQTDEQEAEMNGLAQTALPPA